jgi:hypothetical protein
MNYLTTLWEHLRLFSDWGMARRYRMPRLSGVISNNYWDGAGTKIPQKIKSVGFVSGTRLCHECKMSAATSNFFFSKNEWPEKARNDVHNLWMRSFEPGPDPNIISAIGGVGVFCLWTVWIGTSERVTCQMFAGSDGSRPRRVQSK